MHIFYVKEVTPRGEVEHKNYKYLVTAVRTNWLPGSCGPGVTISSESLLNIVHNGHKVIMEPAMPNYGNNQEKATLTLAPGFKVKK